MSTTSLATLGLIAFAAVAGVGACARAEPPLPTVAPYDVSMLLPLPELETERPILGFEDHAEAGRLLPQWAIDALPPLANTADADWAWSQLRVVGVRFDPCFTGVDDAPTCRNQVRLVWQPVGNDPKDVGTLAMDAAVHTFYEVSREELVTIVRRLRDAAGTPDASVLSIHPTLLQQGTRGEFAQALKREVLAITGDRRLRRVTFMTLPVAEHEWIFGGFDVVEGKAVPLKPAGLNVERQTVRGSATSDRSVSARIEPQAGTLDPSPILAATEASVTPDQASRAYDAALRLQNPRLTTPESADCAGCHLARSARVFGEQRHALTTAGRPDAYAGGLAHEDGPAQSFRAFGYFGKQPSVSARVANETAEVIRLLGTLGVP